jgi:16S rRNA (guanine(966)-N(2))-methyltransferase RsmD
VRIIAGEARGRKLKSVPGTDTRPTSDRVKEAMFSILQFHLEGRRILDLYAGTGQLGIEALSRGARECVFVEQSAAAVSVIRENTKLFDKRAVVRAGEALRWLEDSNERFDIILLDPPFGTKLVEKTLNKLFAKDMLNTGGFILCEAGKDAVPPVPQERYRLKKVYDYGSRVLILYENCDMSGQL